MSKRKQILVLGGGFGGLTLARKLRHKDAEITIVDQTNHHLFQPLLYQVATAGLAIPDIAEPIRTIFASRKDIRTVMDEVVSIDLVSQEVRLVNSTLRYDYLVIALGMVTSYFGNDHWAEHTIGLKSLRDARRIRQRVLASFEHAEAIDDEAERRRLMTVAVVGGGPTGVEMAGALSELTKRVFRGDFRSIGPEEGRVIMVEAGGRLLASYSAASSEQARQDLESRGVELRLGTAVKDIGEETLVLEDEIIQAGTIIWTAGVEANPIVRDLPVPKDRRGRLEVEADCSLPGFTNVFAIGDIAHLIDAKGQEVPGVSPAALQMGSHVARIIRRELKQKAGGSALRPKFTYRDKGTMATIGRSSAVAEMGKLRFSGFPAWALWLGVHLFFLVGYRNRLAVLLQWFYAYIRYRPAARVFENSPETRFHSKSAPSEDRPEEKAGQTEEMKLLSTH
jgi:NADH dehydrogenase